MVDVTPVRASARHLLLEQLGSLSLDGNALVKLCHFGLPLLKHAREVRSFRAGSAISPIASSDAGYKLQ
jgi:hypothetical protein